MSGGSYQYAYRQVTDFADKLSRDPLPYRRAFAKHLFLIADAMHDIEWVDSDDYGTGDDKEAIMKCMEFPELLSSIVDDAIIVRDNINELLAEMGEKK